MEPEGSLPHSQEPATCSFSEPDQSSPCLHPTSWIFILILSSHLYQGLPSGLFPSGFPTKTMYAPLLSPIRVTLFFFLILLNFITQIIFGEEYRLWSSSLCCLLLFHVTSSLLDLNIFPRKSSAKPFLDRWILKQPRLYCESQPSVFVSSQIRTRRWTTDEREAKERQFIVVRESGYQLLEAIKDAICQLSASQTFDHADEFLLQCVAFEVAWYSVPEQRRGHEASASHSPTPKRSIPSMKRVIQL